MISNITAIYEKTGMYIKDIKPPEDTTSKIAEVEIRICNNNNKLDDDKYIVIMRSEL